MTDTPHAEDPGEHYRDLSANVALFYQFSPIVKGISHQKVLVARLFNQERLFSTMRYMVSQILHYRYIAKENVLRA